MAKVLLRGASYEAAGCASLSQPSVSSPAHTEALVWGRCVWCVCDVCVPIETKRRAGFHVGTCAVQASVGWGNDPQVKLTQNWGLDAEATMRMLVLKIIID